MQSHVLIIDTEELKCACKGVCKMILEKFPWANISPILHKLLGHAPDIIPYFNYCYYLETHSEEVIEACNKQIRRFNRILPRGI